MDDKKSYAAARTEPIAANRDFIQGNPDPLKRLYSHADDITIFGGFGSLEHGGTEAACASFLWRQRGRPRASPSG